MPISVTMPSSVPPSAPACNLIASPTWNGRAKSSTSPANTLPSACCAAMPTKTLVSAPPRTSWPIGTANSSSVITRVAKAPMIKMMYPATAACAVPVLGWSSSLTFPARL
jgi:hypothetical protein